MEWDDLPIAQIEEAIGYDFLDKNLLKQAFTTVHYWYNKTGYDHNLPNYIGNAIIFDEINSLVKEKKLTQQQADTLKKQFYAAWHELMLELGFNEYQIKLATDLDETNESQQYFDVANIFPLIICAIYFDQRKQCNNFVKHAVDMILKAGKEFK